VASRARLARQFSQKFLLVHAVLESFAAVDEDDRNLVVELAAKIGVRINIDLLPGESSTSRELEQTLFDDFTQMAAFAGIDYDAARLWHAGEILARGNHAFQCQNESGVCEQGGLVAGPLDWTETKLFRPDVIAIIARAATPNNHESLTQAGAQAASKSWAIRGTGDHAAWERCSLYWKRRCKFESSLFELEKARLECSEFGQRV
jgi:hypothetical protein